MVEQPCVKTAHNGWLDIWPLTRCEHDLRCMLAEATTADQRAAILAAIEAVRAILPTLKTGYNQPNEDMRK